ncbi:MAG TPA: asparagine synthase (glutamine-hydrolyzing) [Candidatus Acidoferrales bacterium]|nr:asparagine synthase (glutamine-hydrolyzing) [Candidatus Acidoferrales bacterium]
MCGIVGFTHKNWSPGADRIQSAVDTLFHRGPDEQGVFRSNVVSLGATRLKIIDLAAGDQPIRSDDGDTVIVFNGEIYNHAELRVELEKLGHRFHSRADTETVLHAFIEWDTACFSRLRGMFAVALWTESSQRLVLARDRLGIKPLYFTRRGKDICFGSELKAILIHPEIDRRLSMEGLDCYLSLNYVPCPWTLVDGIEKLPPGFWLEWRHGEIRSEPYWTLPFVTPRQRTFESAKEELDHLLREAVREHLLSDVPLGVWLSGGIDSSTILHYAAEASSSRLKTLSISFRGRSFDESSYIQQVAEQYGTEHQQFDLNADVDLCGAIEEFAYYSDEPTADAGALPVWFLSKMSKTQVTVTLSGEGADEVFGGYLTYRANQLARNMRRVPASAIRLALIGLRRWPVSDEKIGFEYKVKRFLEGCLLPADQAHVYWNGTFSRAQRSALMRSPLPDALDRILGELRERSVGGEGVTPYLWFDQNYFLPDDILMKVDRMSMAHAVEVRPPFLDHRIVEFAASLPVSFKMRGSRQKRILKELMRGKLPDSVLQKKKTGLDIPSHEWLRGPLRPLMLDALKSGAAQQAGLFEKSAIDQCMTDHLERRANLGYHLWGLMILFLWMRKWNIQAPQVSLANLEKAKNSLASV